MSNINNTAVDYSNLDDHMEEHNELKAYNEALADNAEYDRQAAIRREWQERDRAARRVRNAALNKHLHQILQEVIKKKVVCRVDEETATLHVNGHSMSHNLDTFRFPESITVGAGRGNTTRYPLKKDGSYNYRAIAESCYWYAVRREDEVSQQIMVARNRRTCEETYEKSGLASYEGKVRMTPSTDPKRQITVTVNLALNCTSEDALALVEMLRRGGVEFYKKDQRS